jgi:hypothetical protein
MQTNLETLIEAARRLPPDDRRKLADILLDQNQNQGRARHRITEVRGLGKEIWSDVDVQVYIDSERDTWKN